MKPYFTVFSLLLAESLPKVSAHFNELGFHPQFYLIEWLAGVYSIHRTQCLVVVVIVVVVVVIVCF